MKLWTTIFFLTMVLSSTFLRGQSDTSESKDNEGRLLIYCKGNSFNSKLIVLDSTGKDTVEFDRQISQNHSVSIIYENNRPKYKIYCTAYYDKKAKKTKRAERHHNFQHKLPRKLRFRHKVCFFPVFYFGKSVKTKQRKVFNNNKWKKFSDKNVKPAYALFDNNTIQADGKIKAKF